MNPVMVSATFHVSQFLADIVNVPKTRGDMLATFPTKMMGSIVEKIQGLGIKVQHIPGDCTYLCQPIDVGVNTLVNSAFKDKEKIGWMQRT